MRASTHGGGLLRAPFPLERSSRHNLRICRHLAENGLRRLTRWLNELLLDQMLTKLGERHLLYFSCHLLRTGHALVKRFYSEGDLSGFLGLGRRRGRGRGGSTVNFLDTLGLKLDFFSGGALLQFHTNLSGTTF